MPIQSYTQNQIQNQGPTINHSNINSNTNYVHSGLSHTAFGGFNFGSNSNVNGTLISNNDHNITFARPQSTMNRDLINSLKTIKGP